MNAFNKNRWDPVGCSVEASLDFNNRLARKSALTATSAPCPLSRYTKKQWTAKQNIKVITLNEEDR